MNFCTSCGKENKKIVCQECGARQNDDHAYCGWCGEELSKNAFKCPGCNVRIKPSWINKMIKVIGIISAACFGLMMVLVVGIAKLYFLPGFVISIFLMSKSAERLVNVNFKGAAAFTLTFLRLVLIILVPVMTIKMISVGNYEDKDKTIEARVYEEALDGFHSSVRLKNESSFQLNSYKIRTFEDDDERYDTYYVDIHYSAQNGFGGNTSDVCTVTVVHDTETDTVKATYVDAD